MLHNREDDPMATKKKKTPATRTEHHTYNVNAPGLEHALERLLTIVTDMAKHEVSRTEDPEHTKLEMARIELERDRMKLQWDEHKLRVEEFHAQEAERAERRREQEERRAKEEREEYEEALLRGDLFDVELQDKGSSLIYTIKVIREITGLGLKEAKDMAEGAPTFVLRRQTMKQARVAKAKLILAGAKAEVVKAETP